MTMVIPRGIVYHNISDDILSLFQSLFFTLDDNNHISQFEIYFAKYLGRKHCVAFPYARVAIYYSLKYKNFAAGSEVIMPPITIKPILDVVLELELKPVFVDIDPDTFCFDLIQLQNAVTDNTKAILITYLFGMVPNIEDIVSYCQKKDLFILEDFSQCLNGKYKDKKIGSFGDVGIYSSSSIKTLDTYGGGLLVFDSDEICDSLRHFQSELSKPSRIFLFKKIFIDLIRNIATTRLIFHFLVFPLLRILNYLKPDSALKHTGDRSKEMLNVLPEEWFTSFTSFQAKFGTRLLAKVETQDSIRISNVELIKSSTAKDIFPKTVIGAHNVYWQFLAYFDKPKEVQRLFHSNKVDTSTTSLEIISNIPSYPYKGVTPHADKLYSNGFFIPCYPGLSNSDLQHISTVLDQIADQLKEA